MDSAILAIEIAGAIAIMTTTMAIIIFTDFKMLSGASTITTIDIIQI